MRSGRKVQKVVRWFLDADNNPDSHQNLIILLFGTYSLQYNVP